MDEAAIILYDKFSNYFTTSLPEYRLGSFYFIFKSNQVAYLPIGKDDTIWKFYRQLGRK